MLSTFRLERCGPADSCDPVPQVTSNDSGVVGRDTVSLGLAMVLRCLLLSLGLETKVIRKFSVQLARRLFTQAAVNLAGQDIFSDFVGICALRSALIGVRRPVGDGGWIGRTLGAPELTPFVLPCSLGRVPVSLFRVDQVRLEGTLHPSSARY